MISISINDFKNYIGLPILVETPIYSYWCNGKGERVARVINSIDYKWIVFDGCINITEDISDKKYWVFSQIYNLSNDKGDIDA